MYRMDIMCIEPNTKGVILNMLDDPLQTSATWLIFTVYMVRMLSCSTMNLYNLQGRKILSIPLLRSLQNRNISKA